jgi:hypothetical protein
MTLDHAIEILEDARHKLGGDVELRMADNEPVVYFHNVGRIVYVTDTPPEDWRDYQLHLIVN